MLNCRLVVDVGRDFDSLNFAPFRLPYMTNRSGGRVSTGKFLPIEVFSLISTSLGDLTAMESQIMDNRFPCVNNLRFMIFSLLSDRILPQTHLQQSVMLARYFKLYKLTFR